MNLNEIESLKSTIISDLQAGINIASHTIAGQTFTYRSVTEQLKAIQKLDAMIAEIDQNNGGLMLANFADL